MFYFTTCGWMMWNWLVIRTGGGATLSCTTARPSTRTATCSGACRIDRRGDAVRHLAKYIAALKKKAPVPAAQSLDLWRPALRSFPPDRRWSGEPTTTSTARSSRTCCLSSSISGGTDIISCFVARRSRRCCRSTRGEIQTPRPRHGGGGLGRRGRGRHAATRASWSAPGAFPFDAGGFLERPGRQPLYRAAYFERFPGVWCHGDYVELTEHGGVIIYGRSDAVLNPGGVRIGTAEIYRQVETTGRGGGEHRRSASSGRTMYGWCCSWCLRPRACSWTTALAGPHPATRSASNTSPRATCRRRYCRWTDIPRTISGKIVELAVRDVIHGRVVKNTDALANPEALEQFRDRPELTVD